MVGHLFNYIFQLLGSLEFKAIPAGRPVRALGGFSFVKNGS